MHFTALNKTLEQTERKLIDFSLSSLSSKTEKTFLKKFYNKTIILSANEINFAFLQHTKQF